MLNNTCQIIINVSTRITKVQTLHTLLIVFLLWKQLQNFLKHLYLTSYFYIAYYGVILGPPLADCEEGDRSCWCLSAPSPQDSLADGNRRRKAELEKVKYQTTLGGGESWTWEESDLGVFLSLLPVSPGSVSQRFSGKSVVMET